MQKRRIFIILLAVGILVIWRQLHQPSETPLIHVKGITMGTISYEIKYLDQVNYAEEIDSTLRAFNQSLSTYISESEVSELNQSNKIFYRSPYLYPVLAMSKEVYEKSEGAFDPTVGPLVNAWGFGKNKDLRIDSLQIDSLLQFVGFDQVIFDQKQVQKPNGFYLDFSASAKGYAVDVIADFLQKKDITDYMIEIGGEISCAGKNKRNKVWKIGINEPSIHSSSQSVFATTFLSDKSLATSGNYRIYYRVGDKTVAHTINPKTGYPEVKNLLSASIFANNCTLADAYATACMVKGVDESIAMIEKLGEIEGFLIFTDAKGDLQHYASLGVQKQIEVLD